MSKMSDYLLSDVERPEWLSYPSELMSLVAAGRVKLTPWHICKSDAVRSIQARWKNHLGRDLIPFAYRQDREDLACFEKSKGAQVLIIHDNTDPGWEDEDSYPSFSDWLRAAEEEGKSW